ncbi:hypothetical protein ACFQY5_09935 [Paeniroseomonas aquatica]|uniref:hypothetical protein n=1 Tax=Paeniroseomonas aquatica TaxID=373043 RepID=UPI003613BC27
MRRVLAPPVEPDIEEGRGAEAGQQGDLDRDVHHQQGRAPGGDPAGDGGGAAPRPLMPERGVVQPRHAGEVAVPGRVPDGIVGQVEDGAGGPRPLVRRDGAEQHAGRRSRRASAVARCQCPMPWWCR